MPDPWAVTRWEREIAMRRICLALVGLSTVLASPAALAAVADVLRKFGMQGRVASTATRRTARATRT